MLQSHGQADEEDGWASSDGNSEGVQRSAHSTPHAGSQGLFSPPAEAASSQAAADLQVTTRSLSAIITKPKHRQVLPRAHIRTALRSHLSTLLTHGCCFCGTGTT